jgi:hypothetical protein
MKKIIAYITNTQSHKLIMEFIEGERTPPTR